MDPFSIAVGAVGLADSGTTLAGFLIGTYKSFRDAPTEILEIAHDVEFFSGLVDMFSASLDRPGIKSSKFEADARGLVDKTQGLFDDIRALIPGDRGGDGAVKARWKYTLNKSKLQDYQQRLRQLQLMFMLMESMYRQRNPPAYSATDPLAQIGSFDGVITHVPVEISAGGVNATSGGVGRAVSYQATLTLRPQPAISTRMLRHKDHHPGMSASLGAGSFKDTQPEDRCRRGLENMARSPYFSPALLEESSIKPALYSSFADHEPRTGRVEAKLSRTKNEDSGPNYDIASEGQASFEIDKLAAQWFGEDDPDDSTTTLEADDATLPDKPEPRPPRFPTPPTLVPAPRSLASSGWTEPSPLVADRDWTCDGCDKNISGRTQYKCRRCDDFDYCRDCYNDRRVTGKHPHETYEFVELKPQITR